VALEEIAKGARKAKERMSCYQADLTKQKDITGLAANIQRELNALDILVHSAGWISLAPIESASVEDLDRHYRINVRAPYYITKALLSMIKTQRGQIVFINSSVGLSAKANVGQYAATKHALKAFADSLRDEVNNSGIRVLSVFLGRTASPMQEAVHKLEGRPYRPERLLQPEDVAATVINALSLARTAEVTDVSIRPMIKPAQP